MFVEVVERPSHDEQPWQDVDEDSPDPGGHRVSLRGAEMNVENHHGHADAENGKKVQLQVQIKKT